MFLSIIFVFNQSVKSQLVYNFATEVVLYRILVYKLFFVFVIFINCYVFFLYLDLSTVTEMIRDNIGNYEPMYVLNLIKFKKIII